MRSHSTVSAAFWTSLPPESFPGPAAQSAPGKETSTWLKPLLARKMEKSPAQNRQADDMMENVNGKPKSPANGDTDSASANDALVTSADPLHPANHICSLCHQFYGHGWVTGTGGGISIRNGDHVYLAPSGVQKELMKPKDIFVMDFASKEYLRRPQVGARQTSP